MTTWTFTWGSSLWGDSSATWSSPGTYSETGAPMAAAGVVASATDVALERTSGTIAASSSSHAETGFTTYVDPTGTGIWVTETTARMWLRLPDCYRDADATASGQGTSGTPVSFPLLRWLACLVDQAGYVEGLIDRFTSPTTSDLVNPATADAGWLPWLGQLVGVNIPTPPPNVAEARTLIANAITGTPKGSKGSIVAAVTPLLTGAGTVTVTDHYSGNPWQIQVNTPAAVTPASLPGQQGLKWGASQWSTATAIWANPDPIVWYLENQGLRPAGYQFVHTTS